VQGGVSATPTAAGEYGGNNGSYVGGTRASSSSPYQFAGPGGAGARENGHSPTGANGGNGGKGYTATILPASAVTSFGGGGGGGTLNPNAFPTAARVGGDGGGAGLGGSGGFGGDIGEATGGDYFGSGGGGGKPDDSTTSGVSNAGMGGAGYMGTVLLRYVALDGPPATPETPTTAVTPSADTGTLPYTGNNSRGLASLALTMIALGGGFTALARRRRTIG
jgi:LPXTG-motif cell wall-anchored protein